ncbi:MAG: 2-oxoacid:acceptor oxidoreductase subunit alpha [Bacteroidetes bacterium]|nr:2-oxoacid:acceptor oxidoreductase subunit alpha [Bacteroidota bacterium]MCH8524491.1 2-oxoacid:acceptor oxidoreductase subunit alpha [Balneolales bacterium]
MSIKEVIRETATIRFAGDSGDGMQLTGSQFTNTTALAGNDLSTLPDFPAEIRAPAGTVAGVSGFQIHFGSRAIHSPGDMCDVLIVMNAAALKANIKYLKPGGVIIANIDGFGKKDLNLAKYGPEADPLGEVGTQGYTVIPVDVTKLTRESLKDSGLTVKDIDRSKNMFVLGIVYWLYNRDLEPTRNFLRTKFAKKPEVAEANITALEDGLKFAMATEVFTERYALAPAKIEPGKYRNITGNEATVIGITAAASKSGLPVFLGSYPITPASDILHGLSRMKHFNVMTYQAEDEIAAIGSAIGAAFGGSLGITSSSGPGIALKTEAIALATIYELPLVIINVQRAGPSTGMPTKTEQSDLLQAVYGRAGECPVVVVAPQSPADCFASIYEACKIATQFMIPVMFLSDGYIANGAEPWRYPSAADLDDIPVQFARSRETDDEAFKPYTRNENLARPWAIPGTKGLEHRIGGIEKQHETGNISYDPDNHHFMTHMRENKRNKVADILPLIQMEEGEATGDLLVVGWGGTFGSIKQAVYECRQEGLNVSQIHLRHLAPFPRNLGEILGNFKKVLVPEINNGQLIRLLRDQYFVDAQGYNRVRGVPFSVDELKAAFREALESL